MSVELVKDVLKVEQILVQNMAQAIIEGDILVPDAKPDITRVLSVDGLIQVTKKEVLENKMVVEGTTGFKILYVSDKGDQSLYSIDSSTSFKQAIELQGLTTKMKGEVSAEIEHIDFTINNERKIGVKAVVNLNGKALEEKQMEVTTELTGLEDIEVLKESIQYTDIIGMNSSETLVKDSFEVDEEVGIKEVLKWDATVLEKETKITDGKVIVGGVVNVDVLYIADDEENSLNIMKQELPFTHFVEVQDAYSDMKYKLKLDVEELFTEVKENLQGERKILEVEAIVKVDAKVVDTLRKEFIVDAYSPSKALKLHKNKVGLKENIGMNRSFTMLRETLDVPNNNPSIKEVFSVNVKPILTDCNVMEDKALIEGVLESNIIYTSEEDLQPLYSFVQEIPFRHAVDIEGLKSNMEAEVDLFVEHVGYNLINGEQLELKVNIGASCEAYCNKSVDAIVSIEELEGQLDLSRRPSLTVYFMQPEDTLWQVAKKYQTTVRQIMETNHIESPESLSPGDHIIIEKVHNFKF